MSDIAAGKLLATKMLCWNTSSGGFAWGVHSQLLSMTALTGAHDVMELPMSVRWTGSSNTLWMFQKCCLPGTGRLSGILFSSWIPMFSAGIVRPLSNSSAIGSVGIEIRPPHLRKECDRQDWDCSGGEPIGCLEILELGLVLLRSSIISRLACWR